MHIYRFKRAFRIRLAGGLECSKAVPTSFAPCQNNNKTSHRADFHRLRCFNGTFRLAYARGSVTAITYRPDGAATVRESVFRGEATKRTGRFPAAGAAVYAVRDWPRSPKNRAAIAVTRPESSPPLSVALTGAAARRQLNTARSKTSRTASTYCPASRK